jgi:hypothetical protein
MAAHHFFITPQHSIVYHRRRSCGPLPPRRSDSCREGDSLSLSSWRWCSRPTCDAHTHAHTCTHARTQSDQATRHLHASCAFITAEVGKWREAQPTPRVPHTQHTKAHTQAHTNKGTQPHTHIQPHAHTVAQKRQTPTQTSQHKGREPHTGRYTQTDTSMHTRTATGWH